MFNKRKRNSETTIVAEVITVLIDAILIMLAIIWSFSLRLHAGESSVTLENKSYAITLYGNNWVQLTDDENTYETYDKDFNYSIYALNNTEEPFMFVIEYGDNSDIDIDDMMVEQNYLIGKDIEDVNDFGDGTWTTTNSTKEYYYNKDGYVAYTKTIFDENKIFMINLISSDSDTYEKYGKETLDSFTTSNSEYVSTVENVLFTKYMSDRHYREEDEAVKEDNETTVDTVAETSQKYKELQESSIGVYDSGTDTISETLKAYTPDNILNIENTAVTSYITTTDDVTVFIETYNIDKNNETKQSLLDKCTSALKESVDFENGTINNIEDKDNTYIVEYSNSNILAYNIYKFYDNNCVIYNISLDNQNSSGDYTFYNYVRHLIEI
jgi:hypothetical protein